MTLKVYDYRTDVRNVVITPEIRSRFLKFEPGEIGARHSHDLGHEIFLVLEGQAEFEIEGERAILGPGQMCVAYADERHEVKCVGDQPITMYLSVTPHLEPTHTWWDEAGNKLPPRFGPATVKERSGATEPVSELVERQVAAARSLAEAATASAEAHEQAGAEIERAVAAGDQVAAKAAADAIWAQIYATRKRLQAMELVWNELSPLVGK